MTPATTGQAPRGLSSTGSPTFCTIWTLLGMPAVTLPLLTGADGMPIGVQLVGRFGDDARLLRTARWLVSTIAGTRRRAHGLRRPTMEDLIPAVIGIVLMLAFAGGLAWMIGSPPLLIISLLVLAMAVIDVVRTAPRTGRQRPILTALSLSGG